MDDKHSWCIVKFNFQVNIELILGFNQSECILKYFAISIWILVFIYVSHPAEEEIFKLDVSVF